MPELVEEVGLCLVCGKEIREEESYVEIERGLCHRECL